MKRSIEDWYLLGVEALADGDLDRAVRVLKQIEKKSPEHLLTIELRGDIAKESGNTEEAFAHYKLLIDPMHPLPKRAIGLMNLATLHQSLREVDQAIECVRQAMDIYAGIQQVEDEWNARRFLCEMLIDFGRFADAASLAQELLEEIKRHPKRRKFLDFAIEVRYYLADALRFIGELDESAKHWEKICQLGRKHEFPVELAMGLDGLGVVRQMQGRYVEALALHNESLELDRNLRDEEGQSVSLGNLARLCIHLEKWDEAQGYALQSLEIERRHESVLGIAFVNLVLAEVDMGRGNFLEAEKRLLQLERLYRREGLTDDLIAVSSQLGVVFRHLKRYEEAETMQRRVLDLVQEAGHGDGIASTFEELGEIRAALGDWDAARKNFAMAVEGFLRIGVMHRVEDIQGKMERLGS